MAEGRAPAYAGDDDQLKKVRADLLDEIVDSINEIEGIDEELKRRADDRAAKAAEKKKEPPRFIFYDGARRNPAWLDEIHDWNPRLHSGDFNWMHRL
jgi:hypothetical protein